MIAEKHKLNFTFLFFSFSTVDNILTVVGISAYLGMLMSAVYAQHQHWEVATNCWDLSFFTHIRMAQCIQLALALHGCCKCSVCAVIDVCEKSKLTCNTACPLLLSLLVCYVSFRLVCVSELCALQFHFTSVTHKFQVLT